MLQADKDDLAVRQYYVAFKGSETNLTTRGQVISNFVIPKTPLNENKKEAQVLSKEEMGVVKDILNALLKKL